MQHSHFALLKPHCPTLAVFRVAICLLCSLSFPVSVSLSIESGSEAEQEQCEDTEEVVTENSRRRVRTERRVTGTLPAQYVPQNATTITRVNVFCSGIRNPGCFVPLRC